MSKKYSLNKITYSFIVSYMLGVGVGRGGSQIMTQGSQIMTEGWGAGISYHPILLNTDFGDLLAIGNFVEIFVIVVT